MNEIVQNLEQLNTLYGILVENVRKIDAELNNTVETTRAQIAQQNEHIASRLRDIDEIVKHDRKERARLKDRVIALETQKGKGKGKSMKQAKKCSRSRRCCS